MREEARHERYTKSGDRDRCGGWRRPGDDAGLAGGGHPGSRVDRDRGPLEALVASACEQGKAAELLTTQTDLTSDSAADEITRATRARFRRIDILVNKCGDRPRFRSRCSTSPAELR